MLGRIQVLAAGIAPRQRLFLVEGKYRDAVDRADIGVDRTDRARNRQVVGYQGLGHRNLHGAKFSSRVVGVLNGR